MVKTSQLPPDDAPTADDSLVGYDPTTGGTKKTLISRLITLFFGNIPNDSITDAALDYPRFWQELGRTTLGSAGDTLAVSGLPPRKYLKVLIHAIANGTINGEINFNGDTGANYSSQYSVDFGAMVDSVSAGSLPVEGGSPGSTNHEFIRMLILNNAASHKLCMFETAWGATGAAAAPDSIRVNGKWTNTSNAISEVALINIGAGSYDVGSEMVVLGHD